MFAKHGDPTSKIISSEKNLPLPRNWVQTLRTLFILGSNFPFWYLTMAKKAKSFIKFFVYLINRPNLENFI